MTLSELFEKGAAKGIPSSLMHSVVNRGDIEDLIKLIDEWEGKTNERYSDHVAGKHRIPNDDAPLHRGRVDHQGSHLARTGPAPRSDLPLSTDDVAGTEENGEGAGSGEGSGQAGLDKSEADGEPDH